MALRCTQLQGWELGRGFPRLRSGCLGRNRARTGKVIGHGHASEVRKHSAEMLLLTNIFPIRRKGSHVDVLMELYSYPSFWSLYSKSGAA